MNLLIASTVPVLSFSQSFNYKIFTPADGLPQGYLSLLFQDSKGYLWIGSCAGLTRFDGKKFTNYGLQNGLPFLCNNIFLEDSDHNLWGISRAEIIKFSSEKFLAFPFDASDSITYIYSIYETKQKKIHAETLRGCF